MVNFLMKKATMMIAEQTFENILNTALLDTAHEKLFVARLYESLSRNYLHDGEKDKAEDMKYNFFSGISAIDSLQWLY